jgi:hypothetical protein
MSHPSGETPDLKRELLGAVKLVDFPAQGHEHDGHLHGLAGTLHARTGSEGWLLARILLPASHGDSHVTMKPHVLRTDHLLSLLREISALDVMQHNCMPHWTGHCAMIGYDMAGAMQIGVALCRAKADFAQRCLDALYGRKEFHDLWR